MLPASARRIDAAGAIAAAWTAVDRAEQGETIAVEIEVPARVVLARLVDEGALDRAIVLLERDGQRGRIAVRPRRARGHITLAELLEEDHRRLDGIADEMYRAAGDEPTRAVVLAHRFSFGMRRHVQMEEAIVFPLFVQRLGRGHSADLDARRREHGAIFRYLSELLSSASRVLDLRTRADAVETLRRAHVALAAVLAEHNDREERALFPLLDRTTAAPDLFDLVRRIVLF